MTRVTRDPQEAMEADARSLQLALIRCKGWAEGKRKQLRADDVRRLLVAIIRINRSAQLHMTAVGVWAQWYENKKKIVDANGQRADGSSEEKDWSVVLWCMKELEVWAGTPASDLPVSPPEPEVATTPEPPAQPLTLVEKESA